MVFRLQGNAICNVGEVVIAPESVPEQTFTSLEWGLLELCQVRLPAMSCVQIECSGCTASCHGLGRSQLVGCDGRHDHLPGLPMMTQHKALKPSSLHVLLQSLRK